MVNNPKQLSNRFTWIAFIFLILIYLSLEFTVYIHTYWPSDITNYFYASKLVSEGKIPYKDFFFAHPPLQLYLYGMPHLLFGYNEFLFRSIPLINVVLIALILFLIVKKHYGNIASLFSVFLLLTDKTILWSSTYEYGHYITLTSLFAALYFMFEKKYFWCGIFLGLGAVTRLNIFQQPGFS